MSGRSIYKEVKRTMREIIILRAIHTSSTAVGRGKIKMAKIATSAIGINNPGTLPPPNFILPTAVAMNDSLYPLTILSSV
jgi:hypothetical protein